MKRKTIVLLSIALIVCIGFIQTKISLAGNGGITPGNCVTTSDATTAAYNTAFANRACNLIFKTGF
jgi:hypothetical protein